MFSSERRARTGIDRLFRGVALLFLAFTVVDIGSPEVCAEELLGFPAAAIAHATTDPADHGSEPAHPEEDCFCCCSHLVVTAHFRLVADDVTAPRSTARSLRRLASHPPNLFRPPRFV